MNLHAPKGIDVENWFIECYRKYKGHPMWILLGLYKGNYNKFFMAVVFFFIKHCPVWVLPIITANHQRYYERRTGRIPAYFY